jgi:hypothetical protein
MIFQFLHYCPPWDFNYSQFQKGVRAVSHPVIRNRISWFRTHVLGSSPEVSGTSQLPCPAASCNGRIGCAFHPNVVLAYLRWGMLFRYSCLSRRRWPSRKTFRCSLTQQLRSKFSPSGRRIMYPDGCSCSCCCSWPSPAIAADK